MTGYKTHRKGKKRQYFKRTFKTGRLVLFPGDEYTANLDGVRVILTNSLGVRRYVEVVVKQ